MPAGTLVVNVVGCFAIGLLSSFVTRNPAFNPTWELAIRAGFLGGLTTFSTFGLEVVQLSQLDRSWLAIALVAASLFLGIAAVTAGQLLGNRM